MCSNDMPTDDQVNEAMKGHPFSSWDTDPRRGRFSALPLLALVALACQPDSGGNGHNDRKGGKALDKRKGKTSTLPPIGGGNGHGNEPTWWSPLVALPLLAATVLACDKTPGGREEDDPMHHYLQRKGKERREGNGGIGDLLRIVPTLAAVWAMCDTGPNSNEDNHGDPRDIRHGNARTRPPQRPARGAEWWKAMAIPLPLPAGASAMCEDPFGYIAQPRRAGGVARRGNGAVFATALRSEGAGFLRRGDLAGWFRWVFLDLDRHADDCKWAATLRRFHVA